MLSYKKLKFSVRLEAHMGLMLYVLVPCFLACADRNNDWNTNAADSTIIMQDRFSIIYRSRDGGRSWIPFSNGIPREATVSSFLVLDNRIFATTDFNGIYLIKEGEKRWSRIDENLPKNIDINAIAFIENTLVIATLPNGIMLSQDFGVRWIPASTQIKGTAIRSLHRSQNTLLAGTDNGIYRSTDKGNKWTYSYKGVQVNGFTELDNKIYAGLMNGAIMSDDNGESWQYIYQPRTLHDISSDGERLYAMTLGEGLKRSDDNGFSWKNINTGLGTLNLYTFEVKTFGNKIFAAQWYGIYEFDSNGEAWSIIRNGLPDSTAFTTLETTRDGLIAGAVLENKRKR